MKTFSDDEYFEVNNRNQALKIMRMIKKKIEWTTTVGRGTKDDFPCQVSLFQYNEQYYNIHCDVVNISFWVAFDWYGQFGQINVFNYGSIKPIEFDQICEFLDNELNFKTNIEKQFDL